MTIITHDQLNIKHMVHIPGKAKNILNKQEMETLKNLIIRLLEDDVIVEIKTLPHQAPSAE